MMSTPVAANKFTIHADGSVSSTNITSDGEIRITLDDAKPFAMSVYTFAHVYNALQPPRIEHAPAGWAPLYHIIEVGFILLKHPLSYAEETQLQDALRRLERAIMDQWPTLEAFLLEYTYILLRNRKQTHELAAGMASYILQKKIEKDAWRMRVKKFAKDQELPPVEQRKRKQHA